LNEWGWDPIEEEDCSLTEEEITEFKESCIPREDILKNRKELKARFEDWAENKSK